MQRKVVLTLALVLGLASYARAALSVVVPNLTFSQAQVMANPIQIIPIVVSGTDLAHGTDLSVQLGGSNAAVAAFGTAPPITYQGSEQENPPTDDGAPVLGQGGPGGPAPTNMQLMWDLHANTWGDSTNGSGIPTIPNTPGYGSPGSEGTWFTGSLTFNASSGTAATVNPNGKLEVALVVNLTGWNDGGFHQWSLLLLTGAAGPTDFVALNNTFIPTAITDGSITIVPEPTSVVLGLFAAAGLGIVAIRKRRARRA